MTRTFDDVTDVKSAENPIPDDHFNGSGAASSGNNDLNRLAILPHGSPLFDKSIPDIGLRQQVDTWNLVQ